jgi:hypothetical protein
MPGKVVSGIEPNVEGVAGGRDLSEGIESFQVHAREEVAVEFTFLADMSKLRGDDVQSVEGGEDNFFICLIRTYFKTLRYSHRLSVVRLVAQAHREPERELGTCTTGRHTFQAEHFKKLDVVFLRDTVETVDHQLCHPGKELDQRDSGIA